MPCYHPSEVFVKRRLRAPTKTPLGGNPAVALQDTRPETDSTATPVTVPCGSCLGCRADQAKDWALRLLHESEVQTHPDASWFLTLTYAPEHLPENGTLVVEHISSFIKKLRKRSLNRVSYYAVGEYGDQTSRPHYHAVLCGPRFLDRRELSYRNGAPVYCSATVSSLWPFGNHELTSLTPGGCAYVAGYVRKKVKKRHEEEEYLRVDPSTGELVTLLPEFSRMSRRPGIARAWIEKYWQDVYPRDFTLWQGRPMKPPRYYDKWMEANQPHIMEEVRYQRWLDSETIGDEKLIMKEKIHRARLGLYKGRKL